MLQKEISRHKDNLRASAAVVAADVFGCCFRSSIVLFFLLLFLFWFLFFCILSRLVMKSEGGKRRIWALDCCPWRPPFAASHVGKKIHHSCGLPWEYATVEICRYMHCNLHCHANLLALVHRRGWKIGTVPTKTNEFHCFATQADRRLWDELIYQSNDRTSSVSSRPDVLSASRWR